MKIKPLTLQQITISIDRLTRFKNTEDKYLRVFKELVLHNLIFPKFSKSGLDNIDYNELTSYAQEILNYSIKQFTSIECNLTLNKKIAENEHRTFNIDKNTANLLNNNINYTGFLSINKINNTSAKNLQWLKYLSLDTDIKSERNIHSFRYPIKTLIFVEGATEEMLLPEFAKIYGFDFDKNGILIIPAGGKNQVVKLYYDYIERLKIPIFILLDNDGLTQANKISRKLRSIDKIHIIECGEFEDLLSDSIVKKTLSKALENISEINEEITENKGHRVDYLEEVFKNRGMHDFKKVEFSQMVKENITSLKDITPEISDIIEEIKNLSQD